MRLPPSRRTLRSVRVKSQKDNAQIIADGFGAGVALGLGIVGMINFWNPIGWLAMAGGAVGANYAIKAIESLKKVDVASLKETIKKRPPH